MNAIFFPQEQALLCDYFGIARPPELADLEVQAKPAADGSWPERGVPFYEQLTEDPTVVREDKAPVLVEPDMNDDFTELSVANAVVRIVLARIQQRLPQWGCVKGDGTIITARRYRKSAGRRVAFFPQHLFTMNWADSGPGFSWPEAYYVTYVPGFDRFVVTASNDGPDTHGYADFAIGWFAGDQDLTAGAKEVISSCWAEKCREYDHEPWESFWDAGLISEEEAYAWRAEVWPDPAEEWEEGDEEDADEEVIAAAD